MRFKSCLIRKTAVFLLLAFLHGLLAPALGMAGGHALRSDALALVCGEHAQHAHTDDAGLGQHSHSHDAFCLLCCCPSAPAEIAAGSRWLDIPAARFIPTARAESAPASAPFWHPALPRAPPALS